MDLADVRPAAAAGRTAYLFMATGVSRFVCFLFLDNAPNKKHKINIQTSILLTDKYIFEKQ